MPTFTHAETPSRVTDTCDRCGTAITHLKGDPQHARAKSQHTCRRKP